VKEPIMTRALIASTIVALCMVAACAAEDANPGGGDPTDPGTDPGVDPTQPPGPPTSKPPTPPVPDACAASTHIGFGKTDFVADRKPGDIGSNRRRVKPYSALGTEFKRALGVVPTNLPTNVAAFGDTPARWFAEPGEGAVSLYTTYTLAFTTCYDTMTAATYTAAPTAATATSECAAMQRKFWQRTPGADETKACADLVLGSTTEPIARRRWAHGCASILTSTGFTTY
jgi:hypothetical protein